MRLRSGYNQDMPPYICKPPAGPLESSVHLPGSKSITNRALLIAALADGRSILSGVLLAEDTWLMIEALGALGVALTVDENDRVIEVTGCGGQLPESEVSLFCGNSGTTIRFCTALAALGQGRYELDGIARMRERPIGALAAALQGIGSAIEYPGREGYPPIVVHARGLRGGEVWFDSPESSQMVSALLLVSPYARTDVMIGITGDLPSAPYLQMTLEVMRRFGVSVLKGHGRFLIESSQRYGAAGYTIEPDASNATYFLAAPALAGGTVAIEGLGACSIQGDVRFVDLLEQMGCLVTKEASRLTVAGPRDGVLRGIDVDLNDMPDAVLTLAVAAAFAQGPTTIRNVANLRVKETDRLSALARELRKIGAKVDEWPDGLTIQPAKSQDVEISKTSQRIDGPEIDTYDDHRMAMSFALAGLRVPGLRIKNPECVAKTFPKFFEVFEAMPTQEIT